MNAAISFGGVFTCWNGGGNVKLKQISSLFAAFFRVGALTFGGGYAMLPMFQREIVEKHAWATEEELTDYFALSQCVPGAIAINTAVFIGQKLCGIAGAIAACLGVAFPSLIVITVIAALLSNFAEYSAVRNAFAGIRVCVCVLILNAIVKLWKKAIIDIPTFAVFLLVLVLTVFTGISPVFFVLAAAAAGLLLKNLGVKK